MRNLKSYNLYESSESVNIEEDLYEICYDLTDYDEFDVFVSKTFKDVFSFIRISRKSNAEFLIEDVEDVILRIKDYLGSKYYQCLSELLDRDAYHTFYKSGMEVLYDKDIMIKKIEIYFKNE